jgi:hypothetical protein
MKQLKKLLLVLPLFSLPALGSDEQTFKPISWQVNVGGAVTTGATAQYLHDGWALGGGMKWTPTPESPLSMLVEINYTSFQATKEILDIVRASVPSVRTDGGDGHIFGFNFNGVLNLGPHFYLTGGLGWDRRNLHLTQTVLVAGTYCDPFSYYCYRGVSAGEHTIAEDSTTKFAWNFGGGFEWPLSTGAVLYLDTRFRLMETQKHTEYIPIQFGIRF